MVLAKTFFADKDRWRTLSGALNSFGAASGLFTTLGIKGLGGSEGGPFQIRIKIEGPAANLVDVGYGVSQVLPIVVDLLQGSRGDMFLLQQPEVHLHPRAQAALGTLLTSIVRDTSQRFVVETHSDHLLDRIRMDVRDQSVKADDVMILFFERKGIEVAVHAIELDEAGNLVTPPDSYRKFFLEEERRFLGA